MQSLIFLSSLFPGLTQLSMTSHLNLSINPLCFIACTSSVAHIRFMLSGQLRHHGCVQCILRWVCLIRVFVFYRDSCCTRLCLLNLGFFIVFWGQHVDLAESAYFKVMVLHVFAYHHTCCFYCLQHRVCVSIPVSMALVLISRSGNFLADNRQTKPIGLPPAAYACGVNMAHVHV
jgi:hypothetical protein